MFRLPSALVYCLAVVVVVAPVAVSAQAPTNLSCADPLANGLNDTALPWLNSLFRYDSYFQYPNTYPGDQEQWIMNFCNTTTKTPKQSTICNSSVAGGGDVPGAYWLGEWNSGNGAPNALCLTAYTRLDVSSSSPRSAFINPAGGNLTLVFRSDGGKQAMLVVATCTGSVPYQDSFSPAVTINSTTRMMVFATNTLCTPTTTSGPSGNGSGGSNGGNGGGIPGYAIAIIVVGSLLVIVGIVAIVVLVNNKYAKMKTSTDLTQS